MVPFPFAEGKGHKWRPAVVFSATRFHKKYGICWVAMITSADNPAWPGDIALTALASTGLSVPSSIRPAKIAAMQCDVVKPVGGITPKLLEKVTAFMHKSIGN